MTEAAIARLMSLGEGFKCGCGSYPGVAEADETDTSGRVIVFSMWCPRCTKSYKLIDVDKRTDVTGSTGAAPQANAPSNNTQH